MFLVCVQTDAIGDSSLLTHLTPFLLYNIEYSCGPDMHICCQFDFARNKCWRGGAYVEPEPITDSNIEQKLALTTYI